MASNLDFIVSYHFPILPDYLLKLFTVINEQNTVMHKDIRFWVVIAAFIMIYGFATQVNYPV